MRSTPPLIPYFLGRFKLLFFGVMFLTITSSLLESLSVIAFFPVFSSMLGQSNEDVGGLLGFVTNITGALPISNDIVAGAAFLVAIFIIKTFFNVAREIAAANAAGRVLYDTQSRIMSRYAGAHYQFYINSKQGELMYNSVDAARSVSAVLLIGTRMMTSLFKVLSIAVVLFTILPLATTILVVAGGVHYLFIHYLSRRAYKNVGEEKAKVGVEQLVVTNEFISGFRQILTTNAVKSWTDRFNRKSYSMSRLMVKEAAYLALPRPIMELFGIGVLMGTILLLTLTSSDSVLENLPKVGVFSVALAQMLPPLTAIGGGRMEMMVAWPNAHRAYNAITGDIPQRNEGDQGIIHFNRNIAFESVDFSYQDRTALFQNLNLTIEKGQVTAIVGSSGSGKTSIINLILGLFEPSSGTVAIDGVSLKKFKHASWIDKIGFVSQEPFTYNASIRDNILLGRDDISEETIIKSANIANAHGFIMELPEGYDTTVGDRGMRLSGGQQQRLSIARALLKEPEILIFDEATSSLDTISESQVQKAIDQASENRTVIVIAHRLSTVINADKIIVMDQGVLLEQGNHETLLNQEGYYSQLVARDA